MIPIRVMPGEGARTGGADQPKAPVADLEEVLSPYSVDGAVSNLSPAYFIPSNTNQDISSPSPAHFLPYPTRSGPGVSRCAASLHYGFSSPSSSSPTSSSSSTSHAAFGAAYHQFTHGAANLYTPAYEGAELCPRGDRRAQVYLCNRALWLKFHRHQTEMIITKQGR